MPLMEELDVGQSATLVDFAMFINHYRMSTPGMHVCVHVPVQLDEETRIVPGLIAQVGNGKFQQCKPVDYVFFAGPPNFVFDVFKKGQVTAYEERRAVFERTGVIEYVAWFNESDLPIWNRRVAGRFQVVVEDEPGMIKSSALPGLWVPVHALKERDWWVAMGTTSRGITRRGHRDFMATIWRD